MDYSDKVPVQYEEGKASFMDMEVAVDERVLIPRPETELLVTAASELCRKAAFSEPFIIDVGTGSGIIPLGLTKLLKRCRIIASDVSDEALSVAGENLKRFDCVGNVELVVSDMFSAFRGKRENSFDCVVSNPPYVSDKDYDGLDAWVKAEPKIALYAGEEGMDYLDILLRESPLFLKTGGFLALEIGYDQAEKVKKGFYDNGFKNIAGFRDQAGYERVITGWKNG